MQIGNIPRIRLANLPTPLEEMTTLSTVLEGPRLFIKRDDNTGLSFGGSKARVLEFTMADAVRKKSDVLIATGGRAGIQSNWIRITSAAARKLGMKMIAVLRGKEPNRYEGNLLLDLILGADIRFFNMSPEETEKLMKDIADELRDQGHNPYIASDEALPGTVGYAYAMFELVGQVNKMGIKIDFIVNASGSGGTQAGLMVGAKALNTGVKTIGISVAENRKILAEETAEKANDLAKFLGMKFSFNPEDIAVFDEYVGEGYGVLNREIMDAIEMVVGKEGIFLDPVYTGKAMSALTCLIKKGYFREDENVVFIHTGGTPALFAYENVIRTLSL